MTSKRLLVESVLALMLVWAAVSADKLYDTQCGQVAQAGLMALDHSGSKQDNKNITTQSCNQSQKTLEMP